MRQPFTPVRALGALLVALALVPAAPAQEAAPARRKVIFFIGDGMGPDQVTLGRLGAAHLRRPYHLDRFRTLGMAGTTSADYPVTDSAAAATALAAGVKTKNQLIGLTAAGQRVETILERAHAQGFSTGLVTTTRITHATPAGFNAHVEHRGMEDQIAQQYAARALEEGYPEVLIGGGARMFPDELLASFRQAGYLVKVGPDALSYPVRDLPTHLFALLGPSHLPYAVDRPAGFPGLRAMTEHAVTLLDRPDRPYFLMVEGGKIDHAGHAHDVVACLGDQLDFDEAIGWALDRAAQDPDLLVVVTADHATGSLGIGERFDVAATLAGKASSDELTYRAMQAGERRDAALVAAVREKLGITLERADVGQVYARESKYWPPLALGHLISARLGAHWYDPHLQEDQLTNTHGHDGCMVSVYAHGPGAARFAGTYENTDVPRRIAAAVGITGFAGAPAGEAAAADRAERAEALLAAARAAYEATREQLKFGAVPAETLCRWSLRVCEAELRLAARPAREAWAEHLQRVEHLLADARARHEVGAANQRDVAASEYYVREAELELEGARD